MGWIAHCGSFTVKYREYIQLPCNSETSENKVRWSVEGRICTWESSLQREWGG